MLCHVELCPARHGGQVLPPSCPRGVLATRLGAWRLESPASCVVSRRFSPERRAGDRAGGAVPPPVNCPLSFPLCLFHGCFSVAGPALRRQLCSLFVRADAMYTRRGGGQQQEKELLLRVQRDGPGAACILPGSPGPLHGHLAPTAMVPRPSVHAAQRHSAPHFPSCLPSLSGITSPKRH